MCHSENCTVTVYNGNAFVRSTVDIFFFVAISLHIITSSLLLSHNSNNIILTSRKRPYTLKSRHGYGLQSFRISRFMSLRFHPG